MLDRFVNFLGACGLILTLVAASPMPAYACFYKPPAEDCTDACGKNADGTCPAGADCGPDSCCGCTSNPYNTPRDCRCG
jgi:hypothetical protein